MVHTAKYQRVKRNLLSDLEDQMHEGMMPSGFRARAVQELARSLEAFPENALEISYCEPIPKWRRWLFGGAPRFYASVMWPGRDAIADDLIAGEW